jgi:putative Holliday junction resolvase
LIPIVDELLTNEWTSSMRILAIDPGEKNLGLAISDPTGTIANPLAVLKHRSRLVDAAAIAQIARDNAAGLIVVGQALDADNQPTPQSRRSARLADAIRSQTDLPVVLWDESGSTQAARAARIAMRVPHRKRRGHMDELAATYILQTYLDDHE